MYYLANRALDRLSKKFATANRTKNIPEQTRILTQAANIGYNVRRHGYIAGADKAFDVHWNQGQPNLRQVHIEMWDGQNGQLVPNQWDGEMSHSIDGYGDMICDWASQNWCTTLDQATNTVPNWLGATVNADPLNVVQLVQLIDSIIV